MADCLVVTEKIYHLTLSKKEASWLRDAVQNPVAAQETDNDCEIRQSIWDALTKGGEQDD